MNAVRVMAASWLGPDGYGAAVGGWRHWPREIGAALARGEVPDDAWETLFPGASCPRFGRMDAFSRLGLMAVELLGPALACLPDERRETLSLTLVTRSGCVPTDVQFLETSSPNAFAYALASTPLAEVSIRHRLRGPPLCLWDHASGGMDLARVLRTRCPTGASGGALWVGCDAMSEAAGGLIGRGSGAAAYALLLDGAPERSTPGVGVDLSASEAWRMSPAEFCRDLCASKQPAVSCGPSDERPRSVPRSGPGKFAARGGIEAQAGDDTESARGGSGDDRGG